MGLTCHWWGVGSDSPREWRVEASMGLPPIDLDPAGDEVAMFAASNEFARAFVTSQAPPAFAAYAYDDDFAYLCVGASGRVDGELLLDPDNAKTHGVVIDSGRLDAGPSDVAAWASAYAPMWTGASVVDALAKEAGAADGLRQLMRVLAIDLPDPIGQAMH